MLHYLILTISISRRLRSTDINDCEKLVPGCLVTNRKGEGALVMSKKVIRRFRRDGTHSCPNSPTILLFASFIPTITHSFNSEHAVCQVPQNNNVREACCLRALPAF